MAHNKKRNTAFLFEALVQELATAVVDKNEPRKQAVVTIFKEHFSRGSLLLKEVDIYRSINESSSLTSEVSNRVLLEARRTYKSMDRKAVFNAQTGLILEINKTLGPSVFYNFVKNYRVLATIDQVLRESEPSVKKRVMLETKLIDMMMAISEQKEKEKVHPVDALTYNMFIKKFNNQYSSLLQEQKKLISLFIMSGATADLQLQLYLNEEIGRLKECLKESLTKDDAIKDDAIMTEKVNKVLEMLDEMAKRTIDDSLVEEILGLQDLAQELN